MNYTYDNASRRVTMTVVGQPQVVYTYDNVNRLTTIVQGTSTVTIGYDDADRRTSVTYPNTNSITYAYNVASELTSITYKKGATTLGDLAYTYDAAGNRIKTGGTFARSNIPPALASTVYNANNQQTAFGGTTETYDLNGNLASFTDASGTTTYTWNARNQLTAISGPSLTGSFTYDSFGRRTGRTVNGMVINYVYDGLNPVQEKAGATVTANLLTGLGIDEFFTRTDGVGVRNLLPDALGSTVALGDGTGTLQTQYTYEPFGYTTQTGLASTSSYKYTGREDDGTGILYYRARHYQPRLQRFVSEDPIGFAGGDSNFYSYVAGNPLMYTDPSGLSKRVECGSGCYIIIDSDPHKGRHAHWFCRNGSAGCIKPDGSACDGSGPPPNRIRKCLQDERFLQCENGRSFMQQLNDAWNNFNDWMQLNYPKPGKTPSPMPLPLPIPGPYPVPVPVPFPIR